jgi:alpha-ketoglutarate-dependent taurine dioxygenase
MELPSHIISTSLPHGEIPLVVTPRRPLALLDFAEEYAQSLESAIVEHGAMLFRGFAVPGESVLAALFAKLWTAPLPYIYRSTPRTDLGKGVYTATEYPASQELPMHSENAYQRSWPMRLGFHSVLPAASGGQTPLADVARVTAHIGAELVAEFRERQVSYSRNYFDFIDLPWQTVFQTQSREAVETFCRDHQIDFEWTSDGLRTRQICQGTAIHPTTKRELWFNQAQLFHVSSLSPEIAASMIDIFGAEGLPRNAHFGDGKPIPERAIAHVNSAFEREKIVFDWQKDDVLLLDNMRIAHGRRPFVGPRRVLVSMAVPYTPGSAYSDFVRA